MVAVAISRRNSAVRAAWPKKASFRGPDARLFDHGRRALFGWSRTIADVADEGSTQSGQKGAR